jgi:hypothetical protein
MTPDEWLAAARADAERRGLPEMIPVLQALADAIARLRAADPDAGAARRTVPLPRAARHERR